LRRISSKAKNLTKRSLKEAGTKGLTVRTLGPPLKNLRRSQKFEKKRRRSFATKRKKKTSTASSL